MAGWQAHGGWLVVAAVAGLWAAPMPAAAQDCVVGPGYAAGPPESFGSDFSPDMMACTRPMLSVTVRQGQTVRGRAMMSDADTLTVDTSDGPVVVLRNDIVGVTAQCSGRRSGVDRDCVQAATKSVIGAGLRRIIQRVFYGTAVSMFTCGCLSCLLAVVFPVAAVGSFTRATTVGTSLGVVLLIFTLPLVLVSVVMWGGGTGLFAGGIFLEEMVDAVFGRRRAVIQIGQRLESDDGVRPVAHNTSGVRARF